MCVWSEGDDLENATEADQMSLAIVMERCMVCDRMDVWGRTEVDAKTSWESHSRQSITLSMPIYVLALHYDHSTEIQLSLHFLDSSGIREKGTWVESVL